MDKLRLGVLGCSGHYARRIAVPLQESLLVEPYAIASRDREKAQDFARRWGFSVAYQDYDAVLDDPQVDFVYIPLPNHLHVQWFKKQQMHINPFCVKSQSLLQHSKLRKRFLTVLNKVFH
ncbi:MAG TPA: Gfo/Idh/MocA family oxidoreductase [Spirochaetia bacterium]|nr:Gfo/Idh/MocA family oxidoreductase [Spirochaetia bacterium]